MRSNVLPKESASPGSALWQPAPARVREWRFGDGCENLAMPYVLTRAHPLPHARFHAEARGSVRTKRL